MKKLLLYYLSLLLICWSCKNTPEKTDVVVQGKLCAGKPLAVTFLDDINTAPIFDGLEGVNFIITTDDKKAQKYFNQGMMLAYGFNHAEAARSFHEVTKIDPSCAMGYWGLAYVLGPNYNAGMEDDNLERAYTAIQQAKKLSGNCTDLEKDLIMAMEQRYSPEKLEDRSPLDKAYANALREVHIAHSDNPYVGTLRAESLMDLHPWDMWSKDGTPQPWTNEILEILENIMDDYPRNAGANHLYIHAIEASHDPDKAIQAADLLRTLVPGAGHLVHMPSHIYIRTGRYHQGSEANIQAVEVDSQYVASCHAQGVYPLAYYPHNAHFLAACATLEGNEKRAIEAAFNVRALTDTALMRKPEWGTLQHYYSIPLFVMVKFGMWDKIIQSKNEAEDLVYPSIIWHYARGMAFTAKGQTTEAVREMKILRQLAKDPIIDEMTIWDLNQIRDLVTIASKVLEGTIAADQENYVLAEKMLRDAVEIEDQLNYNEPPDWFFSVRHHLGPVLLKAQKYREAEDVYQEDLKIYPKNGWAMSGLITALANQDKVDEAADVKADFAKAWKWANVELEDSEVKR
ncbi:hypothetical protein V6R21_09070 [Limibacter armeniacum]|uniref:tetratricopeptide repeat protein n=1 Tax=Limibacter armeniacum TaxID=466084 RepID=UPI002FE66F96